MRVIGYKSTHFSIISSHSGKTISVFASKLPPNLSFVMIFGAIPNGAHNIQ